MNAWKMMVAVAAAAAVLSGCGPNKPLMQSDPAKARVDAEVVLRSAADSPEWETRTRAVEALAQVAGASAGRTYLQALGDRQAAVRFAAAAAIGDTRYEAAKPRLLEMAGNDPQKAERDRRVYCAVLYALWQMGEADYGRPLISLLMDPEWEVRDSAAVMLGKIRQPWAVKVLKAQLSFEQRPQVKMRLHESLAILGDAYSQQVLETYARLNEFPGQDLLAIDALGKVGTLRAARALAPMTEEDHPASLRLAAVAALAQMNVSDAGAFRYASLAITDTDTVITENRSSKTVTAEEADTVRYLAALALGRMRERAAVDVLTPLLQSPSSLVRVAAAMSILKLLTPSAVQGPLAPVAQESATPPGKTAATEPATGPKAPATQPAAPATKPRPRLNTAGARD